MANESRKRTSRVKNIGPSLKSSYFAGAISIFLLLAIISLRIFGSFLYDYPTNPGLTALPSDAVIVCLAGGRGRIFAALDLFTQNIGTKLFIVGAGPKTNAQTLIKTAISSLVQIPQERLDKILVEKESRNTIENAYAVETFLRQNPDVHKIILITSSYHMRRSLLVLQSVVKQDIQIIPYNPPVENISAKNWTNSWLGVEVTLVEYGKYLLARILVPNLGYF